MPIRITIIIIAAAAAAADDAIIAAADQIFHSLLFNWIKVGSHWNFKCCPR